MEQLLLVTSCDSPSGIGASLRTDARTDGRTNERTNGWTDRRDVGNSILDLHVISPRLLIIGRSIHSYHLTTNAKINDLFTS